MPDFPPLLQPGLHSITQKELSRLCVEAFPESVTRRQIALGLFFILDRLAQSGVTGEVWLDGSFLTEKVNSNDGDVVFFIPAIEARKGTPEQIEAIKWIAENLRGVLRCDSYVALVYPPGHPLFADFEERRDYWLDTFGSDIDNNPEGIAVLMLGK